MHSFKFEIFNTHKGSAALKKYIHFFIGNWDGDQRDTYYSQLLLDLGLKVQFQNFEMSRRLYAVNRNTFVQR